MVHRVPQRPKNIVNNFTFIPLRPSHLYISQQGLSKIESTYHTDTQDTDRSTEREREVAGGREKVGEYSFSPFPLPFLSSRPILPPLTHSFAYQHSSSVILRPPLTVHTYLYNLDSATQSKRLPEQGAYGFPLHRFSFLFSLPSPSPLSFIPFRRL